MTLEKKEHTFKFKGSKKARMRKLLLYVGLTIFCILLISPLVIVLSSSFRHVANRTSPLLLFNEFTLESYIKAFTKMKFPTAFKNSLITTVGSVLVIIVIAPMASYPISRIKGKFSRFLYYFFIAGLVIPSQMVIIQIASIFTTLKVPNSTYTPMIMFITCSLPFSVFLYAGFFKSVPIEIEESSYLDGAGVVKRFFLIVFPLLKPATVSVIITQGMWIWNDYLFTYIFTSKSAQRTLPAAMMQFMGDSQNPAQWNVLFAACILCALPLIIVYILLQKQFINGIAAGAVKG